MKQAHPWSEFLSRQLALLLCPFRVTYLNKTASLLSSNVPGKLPTQDLGFGRLLSLKRSSARCQPGPSASPRVSFLGRPSSVSPSLAARTRSQLSMLTLLSPLSYSLLFSTYHYLTFYMYYFKILFVCLPTSMWAASTVFPVLRTVLGTELAIDARLWGGVAEVGLVHSRTGQIY